LVAARSGIPSGSTWAGRTFLSWLSSGTRETGVTLISLQTNLPGAAGISHLSNLPHLALISRRAGVSGVTGTSDLTDQTDCASRPGSTNDSSESYLTSET